MLPDEAEYVLYLIRQSLGVAGQAPKSPGNPVVLANLIRRSGILLMVYPAMALLPEAQRILTSEYYASVSQSVNQVHEGERILAAFSSAGLSCVGLKGWDVRELYPHAHMRQMADIDVLVRPYDYACVREAMLGLDFEADATGESSWMHDNFRKGPVKAEIHKRLTDDSGAIRVWESRMWGRAQDVGGGVRRMVPEDVYIYHLVHMHKDLLDGSLGLRRIVDLWLLEQQKGLSFKSIDSELNEMGLGEFVARMRCLAHVVMGEQGMDQGSELLLRYAFDCGIYGNGKSYKVGRMARMSGAGLKAGKLRSIIAAVFLPYSRMRAHYPELKRYPWLLPVCWARRITRFLQEGDIARYSHMLDYGDVTQEDYERMRRVLEVGGCL